MSKIIVQKLEEYNKLMSTLSSHVALSSKILQHTGDQIMRAKQYPLDHAQIPILMIVLFLGSLSQQDIANYAKRDKSSIQRTIISLSKKGLLQVKADDDDKRKNVVCLSEFGHTICANILQEIEGIENSLFKCYSEDEKATLKMLLDKFITFHVPTRPFLKTDNIKH